VGCLCSGRDWCPVDSLCSGRDWCPVDSLCSRRDWCPVDSLCSRRDWCPVDSLCSRRTSSRRALRDTFGSGIVPTDRQETGHPCPGSA